MYISDAIFDHFPGKFCIFSSLDETLTFCLPVSLVGTVILWANEFNLFTVINGEN